MSLLTLFGIAAAAFGPIGISAIARGARSRLRRALLGLQLSASNPRLGPLTGLVDRVRVNPLLVLISLLAAIFAWIVGVQGAVGFAAPEIHFPLGRFLGARLGHWAHSSGEVELSRVQLLNGLLCVAFLAQWATVHLCAGAVRRFLDRFNAQRLLEGREPCSIARLGIGLGLGPIVLAAILWWLGAPWGAPFAIAVSVRRRFRRTLAVDLGRSVPRPGRSRGEDYRSAPFATVHSPSAPTDVPGSAADRQPRCSNPLCRRPLSPGVHYCPRCGARTTPPVDSFA